MHFDSELIAEFPATESADPSFVCGWGFIPSFHECLDAVRVRNRGLVQCLDDVMEDVHGEFALACWDGRRRELTLVRDLFGSVPLFYASRDGTTVFGTGFRAVAGGSPGALDRTYLVSFLASIVDLEKTVYRDVSRVPPGHALTIGQNGSTTRSYWTPDDVAVGPMMSDREHEEGLRAVIGQAVGSRLSTGSAAFELSGGWDSSCLVAVAADMQRSADYPPVRCYSYTYDLSPTSDEAFFIKAVVERTDVVWTQFKESQYPPMTRLEQALRQLSFPTLYGTQVHQWNAVNQRCMRDSVTMLVSGQGGDHLFLSQDGPFPVLAIEGSETIGQRLREASKWSRYLQTSLWRLALDTWRFQPTSAIRGQRFFRGRRTLTSWLHEDVRTVREDDRRRWVTAARRHGRVRAAREQIMERLRRTLSSSQEDEVLQPARMTYPYLDRPVLELLLATPASQIRRPDEWRSLQARSFGDLLPDAVLHRAGKRGPGEALVRAVRREWKAVEPWFSETPSACATMGLIDDAGFRHELRRIRHGQEESMPDAISVLVLEAWLRTHWSSDRHAPEDGCTRQ